MTQGQKPMPRFLRASSTVTAFARPLRPAQLKPAPRRASEHEHADPPPPLPSQLGVSDAERVRLAAQWLRYFGVAVEVDLRRASGADIHAERLVARVIQEREDPQAAMRDVALWQESQPAQLQPSFADSPLSRCSTQHVRQGWPFS